MMRRLPSLRSTLLPMLLVVLAYSTTSLAQENQPQYLGPGACIGCHDGPRGIYTADLVMLTESLTWFRQGETDPDHPHAESDKHFLAFQLLQGELGQRIGQRLYGNPDVTQRAECLSCHAGAAKPPEVMLQFGVSCESCHGPSSQWDVPHRTAAGWRTKTPAEKQALAMIDIRDPETRARQCFSCHIGDADQGRVVTHAMYAAGHPPLPGIEVETFASQMPKHWRYMAEKGNFTHRPEFVLANYPELTHDPALDLPRTKAVIIGGVMALRQSIQLNAALVAGQAAGGYEFAAFDCGACHHDLKPAGWRQLRGYAHGRPGRPTMHQWPLALARLGLQQTAGDDQTAYEQREVDFQQQLDALQAAYTSQPFGDSNLVAPATAALIQTLDQWLSDLKVSRYDEAANRRALARLEQLASTGYHDFHSARQLAWATKMLLTESSVQYPELWKQDPQAKNDGKQDVAAYLEWLEKSWRPRVNKLNDEIANDTQLNSYLELQLPAGQDHRIEEFLPKSLDAMRKYDPDEFRRRYGLLPLTVPAAP